MNPAVISTVLFACLVAAVLLGRTIRRHLPEHHLGSDSRDGVKAAVGLVATMSALLLGLLINSANDNYASQRAEVIEMAAKVAYVDRAFVLYGPEAVEVRANFRLAVEEAVNRLWPKEASQTAQLAPNVAVGNALFSALHRLAPQDELQRSLKAQLVSLATEFAQLRSLLLAQSVPSVATPLLAAVVCWLWVIFLCFSMLSPPNATTTLAFVVSTLSVASAFFLLLELDRPWDGWIAISGQPLQNVLQQLAP